MLVSSGVTAGGFAMDADNIYYLSGDGLRVVPKAGGAPPRTLHRRGTAAFQGAQIALDDKALYWVHRVPGKEVNSYQGTLYRLAK